MILSEVGDRLQPADTEFTTHYRLCYPDRCVIACMILTNACSS
ncbi:MAG: hypothetical protein RIM23_27830 [Coleofasciculus sp. G3-WIS-01]